MDAELEFAILPSTTGKQLFDQVHTVYLHSSRHLGKQKHDHVLIDMFR